MTDGKPLYAKYLTSELRKKLEGVKSSHGVTLDDVVRSGVENPDSNIGSYAGDPDSYQKFASLFDMVIDHYHGYTPSDTHKRNLNIDQIADDDLGLDGGRIISTRIRVGRNLAGFAFPPAISKKDRLEVEKRVVDALGSLTGDLAGKYYPLGDMPEEVRLRLVEDHFLFKKGDRFLESAGVNRDWPNARGIFHSDNKQFLVWVNEEDQLRIISMQQGGNIRQVFERLARAITILEKKLEFACNDHLGYLSSCPTNLGTAMRASVHIKLNTLGKDEKFKKICDDLDLSVRGIHGEHSESEDGIYDISNKKRLGVSEVEIIRTLQNGVKKLIELETIKN